MNKVESAKKWYKQAKHDLEMAERMLKQEGFDVTAFLCHQSVEKLLKAILILEKGTLKKTHFIDELAQDLGVSPEILDDVNELTPDYLPSRYPDVSEKVPYEEYDSEIAEEKLNATKRIYANLSERYRVLED
ncbi:MAG: HEPN domain-containing protein [Candidatus Glassbacteria bacterium]